MWIWVLAALMAAPLVFMTARAQAGDSAESIIKARKHVMKDIVLKSAKASNQMIKDDFFDATEAAGYMNKIAGAAAGFAKRFPKGTESGFKTTVKPDIWSKRADFEARLKKLQADAKAAAAATKQGFGAFKLSFAALVKNCKGCHETYRVKKK